MIYLLCVMAIIFSCVDLHCVRDYKRFKFTPWKLRSRHCRLEESSNGAGAGPVTNVAAKCHYNSPDDFYYKLSWSQPTNGAQPVTKYHIKIWYGGYQNYACFQVPSSQRNFVFNQSMGLQPRCSVKFSVIAQPIVRVAGAHYSNIISLSGCLISPKPDPLPNVHVQPGSNFSFVAVFPEEPVPRASIDWYYSPDIKRCSTVRRIQHDNVVVSEDGRILHVVGVGQINVGCYLLVARNGIDEEVLQRGHLNLKPSNEELPTNRCGFLVVLFGCVTASMMVLVLFLLILLYKTRQKCEDSVRMTLFQL